MEYNADKLGQILCEKGLIGEDKLQEILDTQKTDTRRLGEILLDKGLIDDNILAETLADVFQVPFVDLSKRVLDPEVVSIVPLDLLQSYRVIPISIDGQRLTLATNNPLDVNALQDIQVKSGHMISPVMASRRDIDQCIQEYLDGVHTGRSQAIDKVSSKTDKTIIEYVDSIIRKAIKEKSSDIHFEPHKEYMRVRFRINGVLYEREKINKELQRNCISRIKIISSLDVAENRRPQDGRANFTVGNQQYDLRISTLPNMNGENLVMRILNKSFVGQSFEALGMETVQKDLINSFVAKPYGLVLVTGPTGAGKTTTLYSLLNQLNGTEKSIVTVEDPVEYELAGVNQTNTNKFIGYTFANAIRHILRHDPDIIMIGEIRDKETAEIAIRAALTGHLVLSTIHTNTAAGAITRLAEMDIEPFLISSSLNGIVAQRLVRRLCSHCKKEHTADIETEKKINQFVPFDESQKIAHPVGCDRCANTGYDGRVGLFEILKVDDEVRQLIVKGANEGEITRHCVDKGMIRLQTSGMQKVVNKETEFKETIHNVFID